MKRVLIKNGILVDKHNDLHQVKKDILCEDGLITDIQDVINDENAQVIDAKGLYVSAGMIDIHMHNRLREAVMDVG